MRWSILVVILLLPSAAGQLVQPEGSHETRLYMHLDGLQEIALSPFAPAAGFEHPDPSGLVATSSCVATPVQGFTGQSHHTWYATAATLPVSYADGDPRPYPHRGIAADLHLDAARGIDLVWYVTANTAYRDEPSVVAPQVVLQATLREGDALSVNQVSMNAGRIVAEGRTQAADLSPALSGHPHVSVHERDGVHVYEFRLHLPLEGEATIGRDPSFNLRIDHFVENPYCSERDRYTMPDVIGLHSSDTFRPHLDLAIIEPVRIERVMGHYTDGLVHLEATIQAPFGPSDAIFIDGFQIEPARAGLSPPDWRSGPLLITQGERVFPSPTSTGYRLYQTWDPAGEQGAYNITLQVATGSGALATARLPIEVGPVVRVCSLLGPDAPSCAIHDLRDKNAPSSAPGLLLLAFLALRRRR